MKSGFIILYLFTDHWEKLLLSSSKPNQKLQHASKSFIETETLDMYGDVIAKYQFVSLVLFPDRFTQFELTSANLAKLCGILEHCHYVTDLE